MYVWMLIPMSISLSPGQALGKGAVFIGRSWRVWSAMLGGEVLLSDGDSSVWQSGVFIFGVDHTKWYLKQGGNSFPLLMFICE